MITQLFNVSALLVTTLFVVGCSCTESCRPASCGPVVAPVEPGTFELSSEGYFDAKGTKVGPGLETIKGSGAMAKPAAQIAVQRMGERDAMAGKMIPQLAPPPPPAAKAAAVAAPVVQEFKIKVLVEPTAAPPCPTPVPTPPNP